MLAAIPFIGSAMTVVYWGLGIAGVIVGLVLLVFLFLVYSMLTGGGKRDKKIQAELDPVLEKLESDKDALTEADVRPYAARPALRLWLHKLLTHYDKANLMPAEYLTLESQAVADLAYWMMHPHEHKAPPAEAKLVKTDTREVEGKAATFFVIKFTMPQDHYDHDKGWQIGVVGPYFEGEGPYGHDQASAFVRRDDLAESTDPDELIDWYVNRNA